MVATVGSRRPRQAGFTLTELMVTITIGAILLAIAVPSYNGQIRKSRRTEARTALLDLATREERFFSLNNAYTNSSKDLGYSPVDTPVSNQDVGSSYYQITVPAPTAAGVGTAASFTATATPVAGKSQANDADCASLSVDSTGKQSSVDASANDTTATCWN
jgi:type IV pilus assembly protein PilE